MPADVIMPALGMAQETGKILRWLKSEGDPVVKGEPLMEVETDKVTVDIEAPADGTLAGVRAHEGDDVPVGEVVAVVLAAGEEAPVLATTEPKLVREVEAVAASPPVGIAPPPRRTGRPLASPKARRLAQARGIAIEALAGSGPNGAVVAADVEAAAAPARGNGAAAPQRREPGTVWRVMAERMTQSWQTVPHFYLRRTVDASRLESWRAAARSRPGCEKLSHTDLLVRIAAEALRRHPNVNATWSDGAVDLLDAVNVGIAVAIDDGLVVPVVHSADRLTLSELVARRQELVAAARAGRLRLDDVSGGTFTVSNLGMYGVDSFDAIVNTPQAAILAVGRIRETLVLRGGEPGAGRVLDLSLSFDHRVVDGARGAEFLDTLASLVEEPAGLVA